MAEGKLIVVSNRLPLSVRRGPEGWVAEPSSGGLASAVNPILKKVGGLWIGWPGHAPRELDADRETLLAGARQKHGFVTVNLPADLARRFYEGYANQTLWPLFHNFATNFEADPEGWSAYVTANRRFRDAVLEHLEPGDTVWIHDYHLMLLPRLIRDVAPEARVGFFLHIPFPASETFRILPHRDEVLRGLLGADLVAFQTHLDLQHFRSSLLRVLGLPSALDRVTAQGSSTRLEALPIGIAPEEFAGYIENDAKTQRAFEALRRRYRGRRILLGVDRMDYTKGINEKCLALERLLALQPELRERVVLLQIAEPSRACLPAYRECRSHIIATVDRINRRFGTSDYRPIILLEQHHEPADVFELLRAGDVCYVGSLHDGMNLVAKEFVSARDDERGVLILSKFAGAARELTTALQVNPFFVDSCAMAIADALNMPAEEQVTRMRTMRDVVEQFNAYRWTADILTDAARLCDDSISVPDSLTPAGSDECPSFERPSLA